MNRRYLNGNVGIYTLKVNKNKKDADLALTSYITQVKNKIKHYIALHRNIKINISLHVEFVKFRFDTDDWNKHYVWFNSDSRVVLSKRDIHKKIKESYRQILGAYDGFLERGSGFILNKVLRI